MATYYLISTTSGKDGYKTYGISDNKKELEELADELWYKNNARLAKEGMVQDIYDETLLKNYKILSKSAVIKMLGRKFIEY